MRIGGQAVIEGVLMRSTNYTAIATAKNNKIKVKITKNNPFIKKYEKTLFIRGIVYLIDMLVVGIRALSYSTKEFTGAEDKTIACYENKKSLNLKNIKKFSTLHPRCGTSFLIIVLILSILIFSFILSESTLIKISSRIILIPVIASLSYEVLRIADKYKNFFLFKILIYPGLLLQKITTKEPDNSQIKVALKSLDVLLKKEKNG